MPRCTTPLCATSDANHRHIRCQVAPRPYAPPPTQTTATTPPHQVIGTAAAGAALYYLYEQYLSGKKVSLAVLEASDDSTTNAIIAAFKTDATFVSLAQAETSGILGRDKEDGDKLATGIALAVQKGVLPANPPVEAVTKIDVLGKSADAVAGEIIRKLGDAPAAGCVLVLQGLSGTGKGTTVEKLKAKLPKAVAWSNGNVFRSLTLLAVTRCEADGRPFSEAILTADFLAGCMACLSFGKWGGEFDIQIRGYGLDLKVSEVANTVLKEPKVGKNIPTIASACVRVEPDGRGPSRAIAWPRSVTMWPCSDTAWPWSEMAWPRPAMAWPRRWRGTVTRRCAHSRARHAAWRGAEMTQGEVVTFAAGAAATMRADGCNVLVEGREQTLDHVRAAVCTALHVHCVCMCMCMCMCTACALHVHVHIHVHAHVNTRRVALLHTAHAPRMHYACTTHALHAHCMRTAGAHATPLRADALRAASHRDAPRGAADARRHAEAGGGGREARGRHDDADGRAREDQPGVSG